VLNVEDWAEIRRLHMAEGLSIRAIAERLGVARNTVRSAVRAEGPPVFRREPRAWAVDEFEPLIRQLLRDDPRMPATVVAERIGWERGLTQLKVRVRELRPLYAPADPCQRTHYQPGELAQWDLWFPAVDIPLGFDQTGRPPVIVGVSGYSRLLAARLIPSREAHDVLLGHLRCLQDLGAVPRKGVYDQEGAIGRWRGAKPEFTGAFNAFRGVLGMGAVLCGRADPEAKGLVERANRYLETSFLPGRRFESTADFDTQLQFFCRRANQRTHRTLGCRPIDRAGEDRGSMLRLPPVLPDPALRFSVRLGRDHYVRVATNDYSVDPRVIGRRVDVRVDLEWVVVTCGTDEVARHHRCWAAHQTLTTVEHHRARVAMRDAAKAGRPPEIEVEERDLADYDRALGVA
jgi:transposase